MNKILLAAGAAALAITPAFAGHGNGGNGGHGGGGGGGGKGGGHGGEMRAMGGGGYGNGGGHGGGTMRAVTSGGHGHGGSAKHADRGGHGHQVQAQRHASQAVAHGGGALRHAERNVFSGNGIETIRDQRVASGLINGCPPGLAKKNNGCLPPGQAKKLVGGLLPTTYAHSMLSGPYASWYRDDDRYVYRMAGDDIYRVNRSNNLIDALIPYGGNDFSYYPVGMNYPADYNYYNVPDQYRGYYPDGGDYAYRYGDNAIYGVNPQNSAIQSIVALLAGDLGVGQRLPSNYGVYNVPLSYRDRYADNADNWYRYNDGYIYRVDPKTQLITSVITALI